MVDDNDDGARVGLWVLLGIITLLLFGLIAGLAMRATHAKRVAAPSTLAAPAAVVASVAAGRAAGVAGDAAPAVGVADVLIDGPLAGEIVGQLVFALDKAELPADATSALAPVLQALAASPGKQLVVAAFHDPSGDLVANQALAIQRARAVRAAITSQGIAAERVALRRPAPTAADSGADAVRRVEIRLVD